MKKDYVYGLIDDNGLKRFPTYNDLSEKYNVSEGTIKNKGSKEKWSAKRKSHKIKVTKKVLEKKSNEPVIPSEVEDPEAEEAAEHDAESIIIADDNFEATGEKLRKIIDKNLDVMIEQHHLSCFYLF